MKIVNMVEVTFGEVERHHNWDLFCVVTDTNPDCLREGWVGDDDVEMLTTEDAKRCGFLSKQFE